MKIWLRVFLWQPIRTEAGVMSAEWFFRTSEIAHMGDPNFAHSASSAALLHQKRQARGSHCFTVFASAKVFFLTFTPGLHLRA